jgi:predicted permease
LRYPHCCPESYTLNLMQRLLLDLRLALRRLRNNSGFAAVAILTLSLGIGANTAVFSVINQVLLRPLPVAGASDLFSLNETLGGNVFPTVSYPNYRDLRDRNNVLTGLVAYRILPASLGLPGNSQRLWGYMVSGNYFDVLGIQAARGRLLTPEDDRVPGAHPLAVLSYACWQQRFGGDPGAVGRTVKFNSLDFTIIGIAPRGFFGTELFFSPEVFFPMMMQKQMEWGGGNLENRGSSNTFVAGRRKPGVSMAQAESALNIIARQLSQEYPKDDGGMKLVVTKAGLAGSYIRAPVLGFTTALFGISCLVLLVACTNLASMLLARASDRRKEIAVSLALGASRGRLVRQLLTENMLLALAGGMGGALLASWIADALSQWHPPIDFPIQMTVQPDARVFLFALLVSLGATLLFGLLPALQATRTDLLPALKNEAVTEKWRRWHLRDYMVAGQVAISVLLMVCSVMVVRSLQRALDAPIGYNPKGAVTVSFDLNIQGYSEERGREFQHRLLEKAATLPGVESAALVDFLPLTLNADSESVYVEGHPVGKPTDAPIVYNYSVSPNYFHTMQTRLLQGREFDARDKKDGARVAVVNLAFVRQLVRGEQPIGKRFRTKPDGKPIEIVGVAENGKYFSLTEDDKPAFWTPLEIWYSANVSLIARTKTGGPEVLGMIRQTVRDLDPTLAVYSAGTLTDHLDLALFPARLAASALGAFGLLAAILAATGIYGTMAYAVARRTREIGIRMAIGAGQSQVLNIVARRALLLIGCGTALGLGGALVAGRLLGQVLYGVEPSDPSTFAAVFIAVLAIAAVACWIPARRAIRIDPLTALRQE